MNFCKLLVLLILYPYMLSAEQENYYGLAVIINSKNPTTSMTKSEVKLTYLRKINKRWPGINKNIVPVERRDMSETKKIFLSKLINMSEQDVARYFTEREYMNAEMPPIAFATDAEIINYVANNIGAIGYINTSSLSEESRAKIKIVFP